MTPRLPEGRPTLTSRHSPRVVAARRLQDRGPRWERGAFLVEGPAAVAAAMAAGVLEELFVTPAARERFATLAEQSGVAVHLATDDVVRSIAETVTPQGIVGVARFMHAPLEQLPLAQIACILVAISDPGNAGTILRTTDAFDGSSVVFTAGSVDPYNGKCVRSSAGSLFHVPFTVDVDATAAIDFARSRGMQLLAADARGDIALDDQALDLTKPTAWVFGSESHGLGRRLSDHVDSLVRIPMSGQAESLNLAAAAAICLHASARSQRLGGISSYS